MFGLIPFSLSQNRPNSWMPSCWCLLSFLVLLSFVLVWFAFFNLNHLKGPAHEAGAQPSCLFSPEPLLGILPLARADEDFPSKKLVEKKHISHVLLERHQRVIASDGFGCSCANRSELKESVELLKQSKGKLFPWHNQDPKGRTRGCARTTLLQPFSIFILHSMMNGPGGWRKFVIHII